MDCERFDEWVLDLVYDDGPSSLALDEASRHASGCARCTATLAGLRQARHAVVLPALSVPGGLEERILAEVDRRRQVREASFWGRVDRWISVLGSYAMRPQTAMGALLLLMTGLSLVLLRARPAERGTVRITEDGVPASEPQARAVASAPVAVLVPDRRAEAAAARREDDRPSSGKEPAAAPASPRDAVAAPAATRDPEPIATATALAIAAAPSASVASAAIEAPGAPAAAGKESEGNPQEAVYASALEHYRARRYGEAMRAFDIVANGGSANSAMAALYAARSARYSSGCIAALPRFDAIANRQAGSSVAAEAMWEAAVCSRELGQIDRARQLFSALRRVAGYRDRVERELATIEQRSGAADASRPAAGAKAAASH